MRGVKTSGDYNVLKIIYLRFEDYSTFGTGTSKMKSTHIITVKIIEKVFPKNCGVCS